MSLAARPTTLSPAAVGISWKVASAFAFTLMLTCVKLLGDNLPVGQALFSRNVFALIPVAIVIAMTGGLRTALRTKNPWGHVKRAIAGMTAMGLWFAAIQRLSLAEATAIVYAAPLMMVVLAAVWLGETVRIYRWSAVAVGFVGVFVILLPQVRGGFDITNDDAALGALMALGGAMCIAITSMFVRQLAQVEDTTTVVLYFLIAGAGLTAFTIPTWVMPTGEELALLVAIGIFGGLGQLMLTQAFHHAEASLIAPFEYTSMIWVLMIGYAVFAEVPSLEVMAGAAIVIASGIFVIYRERALGLQRAERKTGQPLRP